MHRIFIVEDDAAIAAALQKHLTTWGFDVRCAGGFSQRARRVHGV